MLSGSGVLPLAVPILRLISMNVSSVVISTALRDRSEGGFSSMMSFSLASLVSVRKLRMALVIFASGSYL